MGTRADFYVGIGPTAEWIGSISYDGMPDGNGANVLKATYEQDFRERIEGLLLDVEVLSTRPDEGWPWPWEDSRTTDYAYAWCLDGVVRLSSFGRRWETIAEYNTRHDRDHDEDLPRLTDAEVLDMSGRRMKADGILAKSGLLILGMPK